MSRRVILLCLLPNILVAAPSENNMRTTGNFKDNQRIQLVTELIDPNNDDLPSRRMSHWIENLNNPKSQTMHTENTNGLIARELQNIEDPVVVQKYLIAVLLNMTQAIANLTRTLEKNDDNDNPLIKISNVNKKLKRNNNVFNPIGVGRYKRDVYKPNNDENKASVDNKEANNKVSHRVPEVVTDIPATEMRTATGETTTLANDTKEMPSENAKRTSNITPLVKNIDLEGNDNDSYKSGDKNQELTKPSRRMQSENKHENSDIKIRILSYADDAYEEINKKLEPVKTLKANYETNRFYKLGYLIANIDTLELNVNNLKKDLDSHKDEWDDKTVFDLYDKLMVSNKVVSKLMEQIMSLPSNQTEHKIARN